MPETSFAGQQDSRRCDASLFTDRALSYRQHNGFPIAKFSLDTASAFRVTVLLTAAFGLGETVLGW